MNGVHWSLLAGFILFLGVAVGKVLFKRAAKQRKNMYSDTWFSSFDR